MTAVENSLRRLQTDHIDLYQIHRPDPDTDIEETLSALSDLVHSGKVRAIGSSSMPASDIVEAQWVAEQRGLERFRTEQPNYSILNRGIETEVLPVAQRYGMGTLVWAPLARGMLTGRIRKNQQTDSRRAAMMTSLKDEHRLDAVEQIIPLAQEAGLPITHLAIAFAIAHPGVTSAIIGPRTMEQLDDLLAGAEVTLTDEVLDQIDTIVAPGTNIGIPDEATYRPPSLQQSSLRRRPVQERAASWPCLDGRAAHNLQDEKHPTVRIFQPIRAMPPSTKGFTPVTKLDSSLDRNYAQCGRDGGPAVRYRRRDRTHSRLRVERDRACLVANPGAGLVAAQTPRDREIHAGSSRKRSRSQDCWARAQATRPYRTIPARGGALCLCAGRGAQVEVLTNWLAAQCAMSPGYGAGSPRTMCRKPASTACAIESWVLAGWS